MSKFTKPDIEKLEKLLGRSLFHEQGTRMSYAQFTEEELSDIKRLALGGATIDAVKYVIFLLNEGDLRNAVSFVDNVIKKNLDVGEWLAQYYLSK
jgi:hypothetical protein